MKQETTHRRLVVGMSSVFSRGQASSQDIVNGIVIDKGSEDICITDIVNAFEKLKVVDPSLISRLDAKLEKVTVKSETEVNIPGVEYDIIIHNEKDQQKITFSICC